MDFTLLDQSLSTQFKKDFDSKFNEESLVDIPDWMASNALEYISETQFAPQSADEAINTTQQADKYNSMVRFTLGTVSELIKNGKADVSYHSYNGSEGVGYDATGKPYNREFTHTFRLSGEVDSGLSEGVSGSAKFKIDYTDEDTRE